MILKKVKIINYRQLQNVELDLQNSLTVLAGPNNSGKTTLISVLKGMFYDKKLRFNYSDIPTNLSTAWVDKILPVFQPIMIKHDKETGIREIIKQISFNGIFATEYVMESFQARIQVDYNPVSDNIQYFADYLMDLDETKHSFYFIYTYEPSVSSFEKDLNEQYDKMAARFRDIDNPDGVEKDTKRYFLKEELLKLYCNASIEKCYFCNSNYENVNSMEVSAFKKLFNFQNIPAIRELDDSESDSSKGISKRVIALLKDNVTWVEATKRLPDLLMNDIENSGAKKEIKNSSIKSLDDTIRNISKTSGGYIGKLQLEMDVNEDDVEDFIQRITRAKYDIDGLLLNEESQGLGFSNLIYLHMRLEEFYKSIDSNKVNVFFIEEPESHMHPQMQKVFIRFLKKYYIDKKLQGLITTHSNEIARMVGLDSLRVIRQTGKSQSELFNLNKFRNSIKNKKIKNVDNESAFLLENFFDWFFEIGYSELIFADKVVLYEGDSERLYIRKLLGLSDLSSLYDSYISFIQVGGAYAHNYLPMLTMLKMKTLIITDLDYDKAVITLDAVKNSKSSNATINHCYKLVCPDKEEKFTPTIRDLYNLQREDKVVLYDGLVYLAFQDEDSTARTLEEAMFNKLLGYNAFKKIKRSKWKAIRKDNKLTFTIPNNKEGEKDSEYSVREIVEATSNNKTDFMYSVILGGNEEKMLPDYIKKGLLWLAK
ncbi:AAA family ATPase [Eubacterium sp. ER2]|uniref:AAA family ATPase n=1 Tax=Eubacterium sp. ER2 TaxID=1519438 RepID=UPI00051B7085|nr:AAA family ATPase [Eubacterium sp. ER2]